MTTTATALSDLVDSGSAGTAIGRAIRAGLNGEVPDALIVFASARYDYARLLKAIQDACTPVVMVGCSSAGEFTGASAREHSVVATGLRSDSIRFRAGLARGLRGSRDAAAVQLVRDIGVSADSGRYQYLMLLADALAGQMDDLMDRIMARTGNRYQLFGGGAGDDGFFRKTHVFRGLEVVHDGVVALEILSEKPLGIGVRHGWQPAGKPLTITASDGMTLISLDGIPAVEVFKKYARDTRQSFSPSDPLPFFLHNIIGLQAGERFKLRVPLAVNPDGSVACAADMPVGSTVRIMSATAPSSTLAAVEAAEDAMRQLEGNTPSVALMFDCVATRLRTGREFGFEVSSVRDAVGGAALAGCNTYGQVARVNGQFEGFHNCTAVVALVPA